jgi:hypothetical protein
VVQLGRWDLLLDLPSRLEGTARDKLVAERDDEGAAEGAAGVEEEGEPADVVASEGCACSFDRRSLQFGEWGD